MDLQFERRCPAAPEPLKHVIAWEGQRWTEFYNDFTLDPKIDAKAFELPK